MKKRYLYFDILKFVLIYLVVFGHVIEPFTKYSICKSIYMTIYSFHMSLFVFIAGFFAKYDSKRIKKLLLCFLSFQIIHIAIEVIIRLVNNQNFTSDVIINYIFTPRWTLWFLPALAVWIFSLKFIHGGHIKIFIVSIILTLCLGFAPFIGTKLTLSRIFYFFPFFILGNYFGKDKDKFMENLQKIKKYWTKIIAIVLVVSTLIIFYFYSGASKAMFYGYQSYSDNFGILKRVIALLIGFINGLALLILVPTCEKGFMVNELACFGKHTMSIYLLHSLILKVIKIYVNLLFGYSTWLIFVYLLVFPPAIIVVTSLRFFRRSQSKVN